MADGTRKWRCKNCGWIYDEAKGIPDQGVPHGTRLEDLPEEWYCPDCGSEKDDFELLG